MATQKANAAGQHAVNHNAGGSDPVTGLVTNGDSHDHSGGDGATIPIGGGGTGQTTQQAAIDALVDAAGADAGDVLSIVGGHAVMAAAPAPGHMDVAILNEQTVAPSTVANHYQLYAITTAAIGGNDANTKLLLHCDGSDSGTTFTDSSGSAHTMSPGSGVVTATAQKKFGTASGYFPGSATLSSNDHADWRLGGGTGNFTIDFWVRFTSIGSTNMFISQNQDGNNFWSLRLETATNVLRFASAYLGSYTISFTCPWTPTTGQWYHVAIVRAGGTAGTHYIFIDGVSQTLTLADGAWNGAINDFTGSLNIGGVSAQYITGYMDEIRISNSARWTSGFTPETGAYGTAATYTLYCKLPDGTVKTVTLT